MATLEGKIVQCAHELAVARVRQDVARRLIHNGLLINTATLNVALYGQNQLPENETQYIDAENFEAYREQVDFYSEILTNNLL